MSDEQPPPLSLRLKPRANPSPDSLPASAASVPPAVPPSDAAVPETPVPQASVSEPLKFRLKPKAPPPEGLPTETPVPFSNPLLPDESSTQIPDTPAPPPDAIVPPAPLFTPPPAATPSAQPEYRPAPPQHLPTPRSISDLPPPPTGAPPERAIKADKWLAGVVVLVVVLAGATWGVRELFKAHPKPKATAKAPAAPSEVKPAAPATAAPTPAKPLPGGQTKLVDQPQSAAGKDVARARDVVAAVEQRERTEGVARVLDAPVPSPAATAAPAPARPQNVLTASTPPRTPVVEELPSAPTEPVVPPSDAFRRFVVNLRVNGVFQGENPRAMLNGKMYNVGAEVDPKLAITLFKIDPEAKQLIFRDDTGAILSRRY